MKKILPLFCLLLFTQLCFTQDWIRQNPFPKLAQLNDIDFDGLHGLAVGDQSTILTTNNGGTTWIPQKAVEDDQFYQAALVVPGTNGQLMFAGGYDLIVSHDGGHSWEIAYDGAQLVYKIQALPNGTIIVHDSDFGLRSNNQGDTWEQFSMPGNNITAGHFTSEMNGWVQYGGFEENQVWVTTDGGDTWKLRDPLKHPVISSIEMINDQVGFLGSRDYVYKTVNGGNTWTRLHNNPVYSILDLYVVNENEIWTCLNNGFIFYTLDGGNIWQEIDPAIISSNRTTGIYANEDGEVWVTGKYVSIIHTDNFGTDWSDQVPNSKATLFEPNFFNENIGIVGGSEGALLKTINGGASWEKIQFAIDENFFAASMVGPQAMIIGSSSGRVFRSIDQGMNWDTIGKNLGQLTDIHVISAQTGIVTSESGKIYKTINGGAQWNEVYNDPNVPFFGLDFFGPLHGWACGYFGQILQSDDGGNTWDLTYADDRNQFVDVHFSSPLEGWIVASNFTDTIWHTSDGGGSWGISILPRKSFWRSVSFTNPDTGWVAGGGSGSGIILRTNDRGQSWTVDHESPELLFGIYAVPQKETVWGTGVGGNIVKYSPCTFSPELSNLDGEPNPCHGDTLTYTVESSDVDIFEWQYPSDWVVYGNTNTSSIQFIIGLLQGVVSVQGKDACGDSTGLISIFTSPVPVPDVIITEDNGVLTCNVASGFYQWLLNNSPIPGANQQSYTPVVSGEYEVVLTTFATGCEVRSNAIEVIISGIKPVSDESLIVFPNPAKKILYIKRFDGTSLPDDSKINLINMDGRIVFSSVVNKECAEFYDIPPGVYAARIQNGNEVLVTKVMIE